MKDSELIGKVHSSVYHQCQKRGYAAPVDVLMDVGVLDKKKYEDWRFGRIPYLEAVCTCNLRQLSFIMAQIRAYAKKAGYKSSFCYYIAYAFSISGLPLLLNRNRRTGLCPCPFFFFMPHCLYYVDLKTTERLKAEDLQKVQASSASTDL